MFRGRGSALLDAIDRVRDAVLTFTANHATKHLPDSVPGIGCLVIWAVCAR